MTNHYERTAAEFLVICRGEWDSTLSQKEKQNVIDRFYAWFDQLVDQGKTKRGQRLRSEGRTIGRKSAIIDGKLVEIRPLDSGVGTHGCWRNELATVDNTSQ
jgi:hypothetical protein